jgi:hypothetical protein
MPETHGHYFHLACPDIEYEDHLPISIVNCPSGQPPPNRR